MPDKTFGVEIIAENISKIYDYQKVLTDFSFHFQPNGCYGISGSNGSGKSTLMRILAGFLSPSSGKVIFRSSGQAIASSCIYSHTTIAAPYAVPILDFTLKENFELICRFKEIDAVKYTTLLEVLEWKDTKDKPLRHFSSGMLQKASVGMALLLNRGMVFLDEPTSFLDDQAKAWFKQIVGEYRRKALIIIASNDISDFYQCTEVIPVKKHQSNS